MKEHRELQTLIDPLEAHIREQAEQIDSLLKTIEALTVACKQAATEEREAINLDHRIAQAAGAKKGLYGYWQFDEHELKKFIELSRESEREACALLCESLKLSDDYYTRFYVEAIRARSKK